MAAPLPTTLYTDSVRLPGALERRPRRKHRGDPGSVLLLLMVRVSLQPPTVSRQGGNLTPKPSKASARALSLQGPPPAQERGHLSMSPHFVM